MIKFLGDQVRAFFSALMFLTRIPCPSWVDHNERSLAESVVYFPVVGFLVGVMGAGTYLAVGLAYDRMFAATVGIAATVIVTGAFHEDAFADVCDGFGGWTPVRRLEIMRDSRVGSFGVIGLALLVLGKVALLAAMPRWLAPIAFVIGHAVGRWSSLVILARYPSVTNSSSLANPLTSSVTPIRLLAATLVILIVCSMGGMGTVVLVPIGAMALSLSAGRFFTGWVGGISGDCLGATTQAVELVCYAIVIHAPRISLLLQSL